MNLDWPLALAVMMVFLSWALFMFADIHTSASTPLRLVADEVNAKVLDFLKVTVYEMPVNFTAEKTESAKVLYADLVWPEGTRNSTKVFRAGALQYCILGSNRVYWLAAVTNTSPNFFRMRITTQPQSQNCTGAFTIANESQAFLGTMEKFSMVADRRIQEMMVQGYSSFRANVSVDRDFRVELNLSGTITDYGPPLPRKTDVVAKENVVKVEETNQDGTVIVFVW